MEKSNNEKRSEILSAAIKLFSEKGFERATVDEIAGQANVGKGTIYLYFENKEHIFLAIIEDGLREITKLLSQFLNSPDAYLNRLEQTIWAYLKFVEDHREFYGLFLKERLDFRFFSSDSAQEHLFKIHQDLNQVLNQFFQSGIEHGYLRQSDPAFYTVALSGILTHFAYHWLMENDHSALTPITPRVMELFLSGVKLSS